jgi:hypothetical protein
MATGKASAKAAAKRKARECEPERRIFYATTETFPYKLASILR